MRRSSPAVVDMYYSEDRIDREVQWAGFGFQVWMQMQTHLRRGGPDSILIIDEPDIYLHPDLQHRLLRQIRARSSQFVMATHAVEIINDAEPDEIVSINPHYRSGKRIHTEEDYTGLYRYLGSTDNADFARIAKARRVIFVEGKDARLLRKLASRLNFDRLANSSGTPIVQLGGLSQWRRALHAVWAFQQILDLQIDAFCIFDRDYRCDEEIAKFLCDAHAERVDCAVLDRKEIENYLLVPDAIQRATARRLRTRSISSSAVPSIDDVIMWLSSVTEDIRIKVMSRCMTSVLEFSNEMKSGLDRNTVIERFSFDFDRNWAILDYRLSKGPGKEILARINDLLQAQLQISLTETMLADQLSRQTADPMLVGLLERLDTFCQD